MKYELYDVTSGPVVAFVGEGGFGGVLIYWHSSCREFFRTGSTAWDMNHQAVYRNFRGELLTSTDLEKRGIPLPPPINQFTNQRGMEWKENFTWEVPFAQVPPDAWRGSGKGPGDRRACHRRIQELFPGGYSKGRS